MHELTMKGHGLFLKVSQSESMRSKLRDKTKYRILVCFSVHHQISLEI